LETDREKLFAEGKQEAERQLLEELTQISKKSKNKAQKDDDLLAWLKKWIK